MFTFQCHCETELEINRSKWIVRPHCGATYTLELEGEKPIAIIEIARPYLYINEK